MAKKNGCRCPFHLYQVVLIFTVLLMLISYLISIAPFLSNGELTIYSTIFVCTYFGFLIPGILLTLSDPTSPVREVDSQNLGAPESAYFCRECWKFVLESTRHCPSCERCVDDFDHHCKWLNNCIGRANYNMFLTSLFMFQGFLIYYIIIQIRLIVKNEEIIDHHFHFVLLVFTLLLNVIASLSAAYLLSFHVYLFFKGLTTYQYVIRKHISKVEPEVTEHQNKDTEKSKYVQDEIVS